MIGKVEGKRNNYYYKTRVYDSIKGKEVFKYKSGFKTKSEATVAEAKIKIEYQREKKEKVKNISTFDDLFEDYLKYRNKTVKSSTYDSFKYRLNKHIYPYFKGIKINEINRISFLDWRKTIEQFDSTTKYKNTLLNEFKLLAKYAERTYGFNLSFVYNEPTIRSDRIEKSKEVKIWDEETFLKLYNTMANDKVYQAFFTTMFYTGMRISEVRALRWSDYNREEMTINVAKSLYTRNKSINMQNHQVTSVKSKSSIRTIQLPVNGLAVMTLNQMHDLAKQVTIYSDDWYIFGDEKYLNETTIRNKLKRYCEDAEVTYINPHAFRHSYTSILIANGVPPKIVQKQLGHGSVSITLDTYTKVSQKQISAAIKNVFKK